MPFFAWKFLASGQGFTDRKTIANENKVSRIEQDSQYVGSMRFVRTLGQWDNFLAVTSHNALYLLHVFIYFSFINLRTVAISWPSCFDPFEQLTCKREPR